MTLKPGTKLGTYEIVESIGAGGMGEVYRAQDSKLERDLAVKVLPESFANDEGRLARFEREARAVAALSHPNILAIYDFGNASGHVFTALELLEGATLRERLDEKALPVRKAIDYGAQIARGLAAAHEKGITHRDLKPENLIVTHDGRVKILDFGLARTEAPRSDVGESGSSAPTRAAGTEPGVVLGTVGYMSQEQVRGERADPRSDVFAFGAILYEMLTGKSAFRRDTTAETMTAILKDEPSGLASSSTPALERVVHRCLEKHPGERFQSAYDLAFAIEGASHDSGASQAAPGPRGRNRPGIAAAVLLLLLPIAAYWFGKTTTPRVEHPTYERLTFRRGAVHSARFDPTGSDVIYTASWEGGEPEVFSTMPGTRTSRTLGFPRSDVLSVSRGGSLALLEKVEMSDWEGDAGTLGTATASGGGLRRLLEGVIAADWRPDGTELAVLRRIGHGLRVELPAGNALYETTNRIRPLRFSPQGDLLAFGEKAVAYGTNWSVVFLDGKGDFRRFDSGLRGDLLDLAWSPDGSEVWFNTNHGGTSDIFAMSRTGESRLVIRSPIPLRVLDIDRNGKLLVARTNLRYGVMGVPPGASEERELSWLDSTEVDGISGDGGTLVLIEFGEGGGEGWSVYVRGADGSPAFRLGEGQAFDMTRDGRWALTMRSAEKPWLQLLPTGTGAPIRIDNDRIVDFSAASFVADESEVVFRGAEFGQPSRWYRQTVAGGVPRPVTDTILPDEGIDLGSSPVSPDGTLLAAPKDGVIALYPLDGGEPHRLDEVPSTMSVIRFSADGRFLYMKESWQRSAKIHRIDLETGRPELWKVIGPTDLAGLDSIYAVQISDDGESYYYTYTRKISDLYLVEGLY